MGTPWGKEILQDGHGCSVKDKKRGGVKKSVKERERFKKPTGDLVEKEEKRGEQGSYYALSF